MDQENKIAAIVAIVLGTSKVSIDSMSELTIILVKLAITCYFLSKRNLQVVKKVYILKDEQVVVSNYITILVVSLFVDIAASVFLGDSKQIDQHVYMSLIPLFIDQCNTPRLINVLCYMVLFPTKPDQFLPEYLS